MDEDETTHRGMSVVIKGLLRALLLWLVAFVLVGAIATGFEINEEQRHEVEAGIGR